MQTTIDGLAGDKEKLESYFEAIFVSYAQKILDEIKIH